ncbi:MAG TPA: four helix bundle protein [Candidatus Paceibacterota bacterium]
MVNTQVSKFKAQPSTKSQVPSGKAYDLGERAANFGGEIIDFCRSLPQDNVTKPLISQLVRAGTSIGANYAEADEASSRKDFINKVCIAKKEARETRYWLQMIARALPSHENKARELGKEAQELNLILAAIVRNTKENARQNEPLDT